MTVDVLVNGALEFPVADMGRSDGSIFDAVVPEAA